MLTTSHAATPIQSVEVETGNVTSPAVQVTDTSASASGAVKFIASTGTSSTCPAYPAFPDATCTGYRHTGVTLTKVPAQATQGSGWTWDGTNVRTTVVGATITGLDISGGLDDGKGNLTLTNSYVRCGGFDTNSACAAFSPGAHVSDVEFGGGANGTTFGGAGIYTGGSNSGNIFTRINIHHTADGMRTDGGTTLVDSYIHDLNYCCGLHGDGSQTTQGLNMVFRHNTVEGGSNDALFFKTDSGPIGNITITQNHLIGTSSGADQTSFGVGFTSDVTNVTVTNNVFNGIGGTGAIYAGSGGLSFNATTWNGNKLDNGTTVAAP
jgi:hypothetical protein